MSYQLDPLISRASRHTCQVEHVRPCLQQKHVVSFYADPGAALQAASFPMHNLQELACSSDALLVLRADYYFADAFTGGGEDLDTNIRHLRLL